MAAEVEQDRFGNPGFAAGDGFVDGGADGVGRFRGRDDALGSGEGYGGLEDGFLRLSHRLYNPELHKVADHRRHAVVAESACMYWRRLEVVAQRVHHKQWS